MCLNSTRIKIDSLFLPKHGENYDVIIFGERSEPFSFRIQILPQKNPISKNT